MANADAIRRWIKDRVVKSIFEHNVKLLLQSAAIALDPTHLALTAAAVPLQGLSMEVALC